MDWLGAHPYRTGIISIVVLILIGVSVISSRTPVDPSGDTGKWTTGTVPLDPIGYGGLPAARGNQDTAIIREQLKSAAPYSYVPQIPFDPLADDGGNESALSLADLALSLGITASGSDSANTESNGLIDAYAFIPQGLISVETPSMKLSDSQRRVYDYGNRLGAEIQSFEDLWPNAIPLLRDAAEDRNNEEKQARVRAYAQALEQLGSAILSITDVPSNTASKHKKLAESYRAIGKKLALMADARTDQEVLDAMNTYNKEMDVFTEHYIAMATHFVALGVTFKPEDPGSSFSFTPISTVIQ